MIRKTWNKDKWLLTPQVEHARLSAIMAASWKYPGEKPADEVIKAIMHHDDGWKDHDGEPTVKLNGEPRDFMEMKFSDSARIFNKSIDLRKDSGHLYGAALVTGHFIMLAETADLTNSSTQDAIAAGQFIAQQRDTLAALKAEISSAAQDDKDPLAEFATHQRFLRVCDYLSLLLCGNFTGEMVLEDVPYLEKGNSLRVVRSSNNLSLSLDPLPFKKNLRDHLTSWIVPNIPYESTEELFMAMEEVKTTTNEVHIGAVKS